MRSRLLSIITLSFLLISFAESCGQDLNQNHRDSLTIVVERYYNLNLKIFKDDSQSSDIDALFKLFTDDFTYIHPKYGGVYSREDLYDGYVTNQKDGRYDGSIIDIKIVNRIVGLNAVVIEKRFVTKTPDGNREGNSEVTLFEFRNAKIFKIFEYW